MIETCGERFRTVKATGTDSVTPNRLSMARAIRLWTPRGTTVSVIENGAFVTAPAFTPSIRNSTRRILPSLSAASAERIIGWFIAIIAPSEGVVILTVGGTFRTAEGPERQFVGSSP